MIFAQRKEMELIMTSGVKCVLRTMIGKHQEQLTINDENKRRKGIDMMLKDCLVSIGTKKKHH